MGKDIESCLPQLQPHKQSFKAKSLKLPFDLRMHNISIPFAVPCIDSAPLNHALPSSGYSRLPVFHSGQLKEPYSCSYALAGHLRPGPIPSMTLHEKLLHKISCSDKLPTAAYGNSGEANTPLVTTERAPKQFIVFDQTDNKTTMMFSSGVGTQTQRPSSWSPKLADFQNLVGSKREIGNDARLFSDELDGDHVTDEETEMREDSDEIDALLYSDNESNYSDEAEETSTGHSPCSMTPHDKEDWFDEEDTDEVASSAWTPVKRHKLSDSSSEVPNVTNAASSINTNKSLEYEDDAESSCVGVGVGRSMGTLTGNKRLRTEKIRETVSILQTIIPDGKGKDPVVVLDEAINYLRTLKYNAKTLGFSAM